MGTHGNIVLFASKYRLMHDQWVANHVSVNLVFLLTAYCLPSVEATCNVCMIDERDQFVVGSALVVSVSFTKIYVDLNRMFDRRHRDVVVIGVGVVKNNKQRSVSR